MPDVDLALWASLAPEERVRATVHESGAGLRPAGAGWVARRPSWLLPARHPAFALAGGLAGDIPGVRVAPLWCDGVWQPDAFAATSARLTARNWWLRYGQRSLVRVAEQLRAAAPVPEACRAHVDSVFPGARVVSTFVIGSYLWADQPSSRVDVVSIVDVPEDGAVLHQVMEGDIPPRFRWTTGGREIEGVDLLIVSVAALRHPERLTGYVGDWRMPNGRPYPYDLRRETIARALVRTLRAGVPVDGIDPLPAAEDPDGLLALAYYFVQEASILLNWRHRIGKAANRLLEASLILDQVDGGPAAGRSAPLGELCDAVRADERDPALLAKLQGWHGGTPAELPGLVDRLARTRAATGLPRPRAGVDDIVRRAVDEDWPTWRQVCLELDEWVSPPVDPLATLRAWDATVPPQVRRHLDGLGVAGPADWLGDPWSTTSTAALTARS
jgi:hypothetical protein